MRACSLSHAVKHIPDRADHFQPVGNLSLLRLESTLAQDQLTGRKIWRIRDRKLRSTELADRSVIAKMTDTSFTAARHDGYFVEGP